MSDPYDGYAVAAVAKDVFANIHATGTWGFNNAGLIVENGRALLVDTLFDLNTTKKMLVDFEHASGRAVTVETVVNTHANGDHWYGNYLFPHSEIITTNRALKEMRAVPPKMMKSLMGVAKLSAGLGPLRSPFGTVAARLGSGIIGSVIEAGPYLCDIFGPFDFKNIAPRWPTKTFDGQLTVALGDRSLRLIEMGPAHTEGDMVVFDAESGVLFAGDLFFNGAHPVVWTGNIDGWIAACEKMLALSPGVVVPGHGPVTDAAGLKRFKGYLENMAMEIRRCHQRGLCVSDATRCILDSLEQPLREAERLVVNIDAYYRRLDGREPPRSSVPYFARMAEFRRNNTGC